MKKWKYMKDRIQNEEIHLKLGVAPINEKMRESRLRWFGHVQRRVINALAKKKELVQNERTKKGRGRPKITLLEVINGHVNQRNNGEYDFK